jgi:hypothetical protein
MLHVAPLTRVRTHESFCSYNKIRILWREGFEIVSRNLFWLSDGQWKRIEPFLPTDVRGVERVDDRRVISGIVQVFEKRLTLVRLPGDLWSADDDL